MKQRMSRGNGLLAAGGHRRPSWPTLAVALAVVAFGCSGVASAAPAGEDAGDAGASDWAASPGLDSSGKPPSMNSELGGQADGTHAQLLGGLVLVGLGALALVVGVAVGLRRPRSAKTELGSPAGGWRPTRRLPAETGSNP